MNLTSILFYSPNPLFFLLFLIIIVFFFTLIFFSESDVAVNISQQRRILLCLNFKRKINNLKFKILWIMRFNFLSWFGHSFTRLAFGRIMIALLLIMNPINISALYARPILLPISNKFILICLRIQRSNSTWIFRIKIRTTRRMVGLNFHFFLNNFRSSGCLSLLPILILNNIKFNKFLRWKFKTSSFLRIFLLLIKFFNSIIWSIDLHLRKRFLRMLIDGLKFNSNIVSINIVKLCRSWFL